MRILILEDDINRIEKFKKLFKNQDIYIAENTDTAKYFCQGDTFPVMLLDHDLGGAVWVNSQEENTGYQFVKWLVDEKIQKDALIYIHSLNPIGANKMLNYLKDNNRDGIWIPFPLLLTETE